jgi:hypothetical protein
MLRIVRADCDRAGLAHGLEGMPDQLERTPGGLHRRSYQPGRENVYGTAFR